MGGDRKRITLSDRWVALLPLLLDSHSLLNAHNFYSTILSEHTI